MATTRHVAGRRADRKAQVALARHFDLLLGPVAVIVLLGGVVFESWQLRRKYDKESAPPASSLATLRDDVCGSEVGGPAGPPELSLFIVADTQLHELGFAHSVEAWRNGRLAGGLYGVSLGAAFFGESMFHVERDASKVALVHLVGRLREREFELLDTQASTQHLRRFGCVDISSTEYMSRLHRALKRRCEFD